MLDPQYVRDNIEKIKKATEAKQVKASIVDEFIDIDKNYRALIGEIQELRASKNKFAAERNIEEGKKVKLLLQEKEPELSSVEKQWKSALYSIPNPAKEDVFVGKDETENEVTSTWGTPREFEFAVLDHVDIGNSLGLIDIERATKVSGARFTYLKGDAVLLEFALIQFALETLIKEGFTPVIPPALIRPQITEGLGYWQAGGNEQYYLVHDPEEVREEGEYSGYYLIGTAEHSLVPMHKDEVLPKSELPKRYLGFSPAFRREAGTYGKDTRGILRMHQFDKVEMVSFVEEGKDEAELLFLLSLEEKLFQALEIPYQVIKMCTGDLGFPAASKYDIEAWIPSQKKYREVTSVSTVTDFQSRRLDIKYQDGDKRKYASVLNGTAFAIGRTLIAILENYQQADGSVLIPTVLQKWLGKERIEKKAL